MLGREARTAGASSGACGSISRMLTDSHWPSRSLAISNVVDDCARNFRFARCKNAVGFVHPGIVVGQLQRRLNRGDLFRPMLAKIRDAVTSVAMTDGSGRILA